MNSRRNILIGIRRIGMYMWYGFCIAVIVITLGGTIVFAVKGGLSYIP